MTATVPEEAGLRSWLVDYLTTHIGCSPESIDFDASMADLGVGSRDAVVLSGELAELLGRPVSPVDFWQHPTINGLIGFLSTPPSAADPVAGEVAKTPTVSGTEPIAVIGLGCRMPGGISDPDTLWTFLTDGRCAVGEVPAERWQPFDDGSPETASALAGTTRWGSFLDDVAGFDADFFDISAREAVKMDPQQRLLLEVAWEALEHAGIPAAALRRSQTGVFAGACFSEYGYLASTDLPRVDAWSNTGGALSIIANRLSYFLDLRGPSITVDTACSSSLVAIHLACQSLRSGDSNVALAAGVNLLLSPAVFHGFDQAGALSPTGRCHAFDAAADGFVRGEGCGVVVLKRLPDALRDGDRVLAVIRGSAINQDGRSNGLMAPNPAAQMAVLRAACANAGVDPQDVDYVEAHGTGTFLGDPIEARALGSVLGRGRAAASPLLVGAVKSNLGHLEAAAGVAGFIKTVMALQHGRIPGTVGYESPNPHIPFDQLRLRVVDEEREWPAVTRPRRAGVSSFGFGGTNAHLVLEQAPEAVAVASPPATAVSTLVVSGKSGERIAASAAALAEWMTGPGAGVALADVAHTLNHHRTRHPSFATVCARDGVDAVAGLRALAAGRSVTGVVVPHDGPCGSGTVFVYSGQGSQWAGMGRRLLADEPAFAAAVAELEPLFVEQVGFSLAKVLVDGETVTGDARVQPVIMGLQLALTELWRSYGVTPDAVIGHSMGEVTAAVVAGALTPAEGLRVIAVRSRLMSRLAGQGAVALLTLSSDATEALLTAHPGVAIAGYVSPWQTVVAGPPAQVDAVIAAVQEQNRFARRVNMEVASHTALMDPILDELRSALADLTPNTTSIPFISTVEESTAPLLDSDYWVANVRRPVRLSQAFRTAADEHATFVEISAHPMLTNAVTETLGDAHHHAVGTLARDTDDTVTFHTNLNTTHTTHPPVTTHPAEPHPVLPATPWQHTRFWMDPTAPRRTATASAAQQDSDATAGGVVPAEWNCELTWPVRPAADAQPVTGTWLVVGDPALAARLDHELGADARVSVIDETTVDNRLEFAVAGADHVVYAPAVPAAFDAAAGRRLFDVARRLTVVLTAVPDPGRLYFLTRNAQPVSVGDRANPAHAVLWGLGRTLALEHPEIWGAAIDLDELVPDRVAARYLVTEAGSADGEDQVVYRAGERRVARLRRTAAPRPAGAGLDPTGSHLVVGATGNIGPHLIRQLADMGATTVVAVSRNPGDRLVALTETLAARGTTLVTVAADAADEDLMRTVFDRFGADLPPLAGIYLAAFGGGPVTLADMTDDDVTAMFAPKLDAVSVLHTLSATTDIQQFVLFSSISGVLGSRWLAHYTATTTFLDTFAFARRAAGLPATAVNWGLWKSLADNYSEHERQITMESGLEPMADEVAIQALWAVTAPGAPARSTVVAADWPRLAAAYRTKAALRIVDDLIDDGDAEAGTTSTVAETEFRRRLRESADDDREALLRDHVRALVASSMGLTSPQLVDPSAGFFQCGMDSLMSVTLKRELGESLGETLPASVIFDYPTVDGLTEYLATVLPELIEVAGSDEVDDYDEFSDDELLQQLSERLS
ncbi:SDR family NAD(P)-dependent oxidoreductase [Mycobacterium sp. GA-2829]|uniref:SDR family NAD(P)-dependent oxidoreductase n=1 Tax=Mycobacterium sp. GA-2829 TaxID=1772283 RepID=UPI00073FC3E5|nr:type I polyketide synthase [Mycobacterium sp. GA-2829]KUI25928.1 polyketide synthase [Mycobacterium sp. GA-2829]